MKNNSAKGSTCECTGELSEEDLILQKIEVKRQEKIQSLISERAMLKKSSDKLQADIAQALKENARIKKSYYRLSSSRFVNSIWNNLRKLSGHKAVDFIPVEQKAETDYKLPSSNKLLKETHARIIKDASQIKDSILNLHNADKPSVAIITDEFMYNFYKDVFNLSIVTSGNYEELLEGNDFDFILYVSCWHGMDADGTQYVNGGDFSGRQGVELACDILYYAKTIGLTTVFQSIEDPPNYEEFLDIAKISDYIFTSAEEVIPSYIADCANNKVWPLSFAANPIQNNPIGFLSKWKNPQDVRNSEVFFAGSWMNKYPKRCTDFDLIAQGVLSSDAHTLKIADRNAFIESAADYAFPHVYTPYVIPPFDHKILQKVHKLYNWNINVNSVINSETMCAMRVYELQALGSIVLSNYSLAVCDKFLNIFTITDVEEAQYILNGYTNREIINIQLEGIRKVLSEHTVQVRADFMLEKIGQNTHRQDAMLYVVYDPNDVNFENQITCQHMTDIVKLRKGEEEQQLKGVQSGYVYWWNKPSENPFYLQDMYNSFKFSGADYAYYVDEKHLPEAYDYVNLKVVPENSIYDLSRHSINDILEGRLNQENAGFALIQPLWGRSTAGAQKELAVIVPVYNNGEYLEKRCFRSLLRSSIFNKMTIYLIDDGSTDEYTKSVIKRLERDYDNVNTYFFDDGGSGSASRPRNKGIDIASEPYITFLDPDNEAVGDGYCKLQDIVKEEDVDFAFGAVPMVRKLSYQMLCFHSYGLIENPREIMLGGTFWAQSMQAMVFKTDFLVNSGIRLKVGVIGEDTLFAYEIFNCAEKVFSVNSPVHIYYAQREASAVNSIDVNFFKMSYERTLSEVAFLKENGLHESFMMNRFDYFFKNWYCEKIKLVKSEDMDEALAILEDIYNLYTKTDDDEKRN